MTTYDDEAVGKAIIDGLIRRRLAACVQAFPVRSVYRWKGKVQREKETLLFIKTRSALYREIEAFIKAAHSYEVPEIVMIPMTKGSSSYLDWVSAETPGKLAEQRSRQDST